ncbi:MAG: phosphomethylpyrimidine synthase ThiC, partial [Bacteroidales bacterium]
MNTKITRTPFPNSEKIFVAGKLFPIQVAMRQVNLTDSVKVVDGKRVRTSHDPVVLYDTSGPYTDPEALIDLELGLPRLRESWIKSDKNIEQLTQLTSEYGRMRE